MKYFFITVFVKLSITFTCIAQISPTPVINNEIKDNSSIRMRGIDLERVKRDAKKPGFDFSLEARQIKFAKIKNEFENIQKLQDSIIEAYTKGKKINFDKIYASAEELNENAVKLKADLFESEQIQNTEVENLNKTGVKDLIIELDNAIGKFVSSNFFQKSKTITSEESNNTHQNLEMIIRLSSQLVQEAKKLR